MFYYKQIDENGSVVSAMTSNTHLKESASQIEITQEEYEQIIASIPEPEEPEPTGYMITQAEIEAAYQEGVQEA